MPRCLLQPSPRHPGSENSQQLPASGSFSSSHGCTSAGFTLPHVLIPVGSTDPACFWLSCRDPSSAPASTALSRCLAAVSFRFAFLSNVAVPSQSYSRRWGPEHPRWLLPEADQHQESGWSFPMLGALTHRGSALKATGGISTKYKILSTPPVQPPPDNVPRPARKHNYYGLHPRLGLQPAPRCSSSWVFRSAPSRTDLCQFHQRGNGAAHPGRTGCQAPLH